MSSKYLLIGSGGREHAMARALVTSEKVERVFVAPGNGGTAQGDDRIVNIDLDVLDFDALLGFARAEEIAYTIVGPEAPLAAGIVDRWQREGLKCFGPTQAAAQLESSKAFSKSFMDRWSIPTARWRAFTDFEAAKSYLAEFPRLPVIKASGLAAGKGVILPSTMDEAIAALEEMMLNARFGDAGDEVVIEERMIGPEISLLAICDGESVHPLPAARDHKRLLNGDLGPNTGGMGAIAPIIGPETELYQTLTQMLQCVVDGMREEGTPYVGVLYGGFMITPEGPRVLEFNCRFGDPETQAVLPLLPAGGLVGYIQWALDGGAPPAGHQTSSGAAATIVLASEGYPGRYPKGRVISGLDAATDCPNVYVYHAGTRRKNDAVETSGGRVLAVTGLGEDLERALSAAYSAADLIEFDGKQFRTDVGVHRS
jgi:phosphoribosylamine--glycine ligase